jgi:hypothetical protein
MDDQVRQLLAEFHETLGGTISGLKKVRGDTAVELKLGPAGCPPIVGDGCNISRTGCRGAIDSGGFVKVTHVIELLEQVRDVLEV